MPRAALAPMPARRVLVPIDFSDASRAALAEADALTSAEGELWLLHVHPLRSVVFMDFTYVEPPDEVARLLGAAGSALERLSADLETPRGRRHYDVTLGEPAHEIIRRSSEFDLVVMATHGRSGVSRLLLGSVAERVVRGAHCSVLVVRGGQKAPPVK